MFHSGKSFDFCKQRFVYFFSKQLHQIVNKVIYFKSVELLFVSSNCSLLLTQADVIVENQVKTSIIPPLIHYHLSKHLRTEHMTPTIFLKSCLRVCERGLATRIRERERVTYIFFPIVTQLCLTFSSSHKFFAHVLNV